MKRNSIYHTGVCTVAAVLTAVVFPAKAQEDRKDKNLNREMTLEREYDPSVQDASKVNSLPAVREPNIRKAPIEYARLAWPLEPEKAIGILGPGGLATEMPDDKRRGYLNFGIGNYLNIDGDAGYHILDTEKDRLQVFFSHRSTNGKIKLLTPDGVASLKSKAKLNDNLGTVRFVHDFDRASLQLGMQYGYSAFDYYGYFPGIDPATMLTDNQGNQQIAFRAGVRSGESASFNYSVDLNYRNFSYKYALNPDTDGAKEHAFDARLDLNAGWDDHKKVGLGARVDYYSYGLPSGYADEFAGFDDRALITLNPYFATAGERWNVKLGANVMFMTGPDSKACVSPAVIAEAEVADKTVLYGNFLGELRANSLYEVAQENRYVDPTEKVLPSRTWLDGSIGLKSGVAPGFWFDIFAGYRITSDDHFFIPEYAGSTAAWGNVGRAVLLDSKCFRAGASLKYSLRQQVEFLLKGVYQAWDVSAAQATDVPDSYEFKAYNKPEFELEAGVTVRPVDKVSIGAAYYLGSGRYTTLVPGSSDPVKMDNINELNLNGAYTLNKTLGVYVKLNNLLGRKYDWFPGYTAQGFHVMAGVNVNF